jgi:RHS repeat-associated protein
MQDAPDFEDRGSIYVSGILAFEAEYAYDRSGNLTKDNNKKILNIKYNRNNQATEIEFEGDRKIINFRDGSGAVYKKEVWENGTMLRKTEYGGRFVYEGQNTNVPNYLSFVSMPEGRMAVDSLRKRLEPEFHYTDHLGNLRLAYRNAAPFYEVTAEPDRDAEEETHFATLDAFRTDETAHTGSYALKSGIYEQIVIPVVANEKLKLSVWGMATCNWGASSKTTDPNTHTSAKLSKTDDLSGFLAPALGFSDIQSQVAEGKIQNKQLRFNLLSLFPLVQKLLKKKEKSSTAKGGALTPASVLEPVLTMQAKLYDASGALVQTWTKTVNPTSEAWQFMVLNADISVSGTLKVSLYDNGGAFGYCPSGSAFFDNFRVQRHSPVVFQENSYDPYGLNLKGIEENDTQTQQNLGENRMQYNGKEKTEDFSLMWNDHGARNLDLQTGRWTGVDELAHKYWETSPFVSMGNNPIKFVDLDGRQIDDYYDERGKFLGTDGTATNNLRLIRNEDFQSSSNAEEKQIRSRIITVDQVGIDAAFQTAKDNALNTTHEYSFLIVLDIENAVITATSMGTMNDNKISPLDYEHFENGNYIVSPENDEHVIIGQGHSHPESTTPGERTLNTTSNRDSQSSRNTGVPIYAIDAMSNRGQADNVHRVTPNGVRSDNVGRNDGSFNFGRDALEISGGRR